MALNWCDQATPRMPGFSEYTIDVPSAELPCGAGWLASVLLELGVSVWHPWGADFSAEWMHLGQNRFRYLRPDEGWRRVVPALVHNREFAFAERPVPRFGHHWPMQHRPLPAILIVRDPRDALYSAWRRERALTTLEEDVPFERFVHLPFRHWSLSWSAMLALHTASWLRHIAEHGGSVLRFEDFKRDALRVARRSLTSLGVARTTAELMAAVDASDHRVLARAESMLLARGVVRSAIAQHGIAGEWRNHFTPTMHMTLPAALWRVFRHVGYTPELPSAAPDPAFASISTDLGGAAGEFALSAIRHIDNLAGHFQH